MKRSRKRTRGLGAPDKPGEFMGVKTPLLITGLVLAAGVAWANSGPAEPTSTDVVNNDPTAGPSTSGSSGSTSTSSGSTKPATVTKKPKRAAVVKEASPLTYVFVNSLGGEGIFDRLRAKFDVLHAADGYGISRIATLSNGEYAGLATGKVWTSTESGRVYIQIVAEVNNVLYNYWIEKSQTVAMHYAAMKQAMAAQNYMWGASVLFGAVQKMSDATRNRIASFYFNNYTL